MTTSKNEDGTSDGHGPSTWERVREALRRDWEQTRHELTGSSGHELNQDAVDTLKQAVGRQPIPLNDAPNPPRVVATWEQAEHAIRFGYEAAQLHAHGYPTWTSHLASMLAKRWSEEQRSAPAWKEMEGFVRHGYEYRHVDA